MKHVAILLAGGSGSRMGGSVEDKILVQVHDRPVFAHALRAFINSGVIDALVIVARSNEQRKILSEMVRREGPGLPVFYTLGGKQRQDSVRAGLSVLPTVTEWVLIHDCARPAVSELAIQSVLKTTKQLNCAVSLAKRVSDTIREFDNPPIEAPAVGKILDRQKLWAMETPQGFPRQLIEKAHAELSGGVTDDLAAVEVLGGPVALVESLQHNPKITRPADLMLIESLLKTNTMNTENKHTFRVGLGYDIHQLKPGLPLTLGGVKIASDVGLEGHSDADVLSHAIADAILGACGLPDIGHFFPNSDQSIKGISSLTILKRARKEAKKRGFQIINVDSTLIAEQPKISPFLNDMKSALSKVLKLKKGEIGIKATTNETLGSLGAGKGIAAHAVVALGSITKEDDDQE